MGRPRKDETALLQDEKIKSILEVFLIKQEKGLKFSDIQKATNIEPRSTLYNKLKQLKRANIVFQKKKGGPYFLKEKYYNYAFHNYLFQKIGEVLPNAMIPFHAMPEDWAYYGIRPDLLTPEEKRELYNIASNFSDRLRTIKKRQVEKGIEFMKTRLLASISLPRWGEKEKRFIYENKNNINLVSFASFLYTNIGKNLNKKEIRKALRQHYSKDIFDTSWKLDIFTELTSACYRCMEKIYPLTVSFCLNQNDIWSEYWLGNMLYPEHATINESKKEEKKNIEISSYIQQMGECWDYIHYILTNTEFARREKYMAYIYGNEQEQQEKEAELEYWEDEEKTVLAQIGDREKRKHKKKLLEWIAFRFRENMISLRHIDNLDLILKDVPDIEKKQREYFCHYSLNDLKFWALRYRAVSGGKKISLSDIFNNFKHNKIEEKTKQFLKKYCH
ncbi:MAG: hypothetical protein PHZ19_01560 [Candidatus Thermoplasmatota archaeon]|nr:hypothetical protein [Candidatus Thermoplasmatota archaeon]